MLFFSIFSLMQKKFSIFFSSSRVIVEHICEEINLNKENKK